MAPDISAANDMLRTEKIWNCCRHYMENYHAKQVKLLLGIYIGNFYLILDLNVIGWDQMNLYLSSEYGNKGFQSNRIYIW